MPKCCHSDIVETDPRSALDVYIGDPYNDLPIVTKNIPRDLHNMLGKDSDDEENVICG